MKKIFKRLSLCALLTCWMPFPPALDAASVKSENPNADSVGYRLIWQDEFNVDGPLDPAHWQFVARITARAVQSGAVYTASP